ncbi:hypothetical protein ACFLR8_04295 [Bacteroidota bacterium]
MNAPPGIDKKILRRMKYTSDQKGIMNRYLSEGDNWDQHLVRTRDFIVSCLEKSQAGSVAVLGSGWLLDVPLEFLCGHFKEVFLVDIVHPRQIVHKIKGIKNARLVSADVTGGAIEGAYNLVRNYRKTGSGNILDIACQASLTGIKADYVISLNILNQLDILLVDFITGFIEVPEEEKAIFRKRIQQQHVNLLKSRCSCLISDIEERILNRENKIISTKSLVYADLPEGDLLEEWIWTFDTRGEYNPKHSTEMLVRAICF